MKNKILLKENEALSNSIIKQKQDRFSNSQTVLAGLAAIGLEIDRVNDWQKEVEPYFMEQFPTSTLDFNLDAKGIKQQYLDLEAFYKSSSISFEAPTDDEIEAIKEQYRSYADTPEKLEAYELANSVVKDLNRLKELGIAINSFYASNLSPIFVGEAKGGFEIYQKNFIEAVASLK